MCDAIKRGTQKIHTETQKIVTSKMFIKWMQLNNLKCIYYLT